MRIPTICHICDFGPEYGGTFIDALLFLSRYCRDSLHITTFCVFPERARNRRWLLELDKEGIGYGFVSHNRNVAGQVRRLLLDREPLILHSHFFFFDLTSLVLKYTTFKTAKVVWHYHNPVGGTVKQRIKDSLKVRLLFNLMGDYCIAVGDGVYKSIRDAGLASEKSILLYNGIDTDRFLSKRHDVSLESGKNLGITAPHDVVFLLLGWDPVRKGIDVFFRAAEELSRTYKHCRFLVVGRTKAREFVSQLMRESFLTNDAFRVIDPVEDFNVLLNVTDVFVSASRSEGFTYSVLEAMMAGKIVLASDIAAVRETYGRSEGAWLFPTEDWKMLAKLMEKSVSLTQGKKQSLGLINSQYVIENHSLDRWCEEVGQVYRLLLGKVD